MRFCFTQNFNVAFIRFLLVFDFSKSLRCGFDKNNLLLSSQNVIPQATLF